ncbi:Short chain dehydrogenase citE [Cladobotryum mycophilum]|uniref:Short chain dehydrogenase citE n=1 Tax=Cladobotryum mycophilum TaxID=491253 RepID=A0ABR0SIN0_9HYPO
MPSGGPLDGLPDDYVVTSQAFTKKTYRDLYPAIDPSDAALSQAGRVVIVTGASRGIGKQGFVRSFAVAGAKAIVLVARSLDRLKEAAEELGREFPSTKFLPLGCDIQDEASVKLLFKQIQDNFGTADVLVNNAGAFGEHEQIRSASIQRFWNDVEINLKGSLLVVQGFLNLVGESKEATIVNVSSAMGHVVMPGSASYCLSKLAMTQLSRFIALENPNVRAISFHPGTVLTDITADWLKPFSKDTPELAGGCAVWLTTKDAGFLNGRYVSANWSVEELLSRSSEITAGGKLHIDLVGEIVPQ